MKKRLFAILLTLLMLQCYVLPAVATDSQTPEDPTAISDTPTEGTQPPAQPPTEATQPPTQPPTEATQPPTEATTPTTPTTPTDPLDPTAPTSPSNPTTPPASCSHTYGEWSADETTHSRACTKCGATDSGGHTWYGELITVAPTCKDGGGTAKVCTTCGLILIVEVTLPLTTHTYDNACDTECNVCGLKREITHNYSAAWSKNAKGHWHACTVCGAAGEVKAHYPGPAATEEKEQLCLTCGYVMMQKKNHIHKLDTVWSSDEFGHWYKCTGCSEQMSYADHSYTDSCDSDCDICGHTRTPLHTYGTDWQQDETTHSGVCTVCGEQGPVEEHSADDSGTACSFCGYPMEPPHEHSFDGDVWGFDDHGHWHTCMCGEKQSSAPHEWDDGKKTGDSIHYTCKVCGMERQEPVPESNFPWFLLIAGIVGLAATVGIVVCIVMLRRTGKYSH